MKSGHALAGFILTIVCFSSAWAQPTKTTVVTTLGVPAILVEPETPRPRNHIGIVTMHSDGNYLSGSNCTPLAQRGYRALCMNNQFTNNGDNIEGFYQIAPSIARGINHLRGLVGGNGKVGVMGHSMGGPLMSFYQNAAENGPSACRSPRMIYPCPGEGLTNLPKAATTRFGAYEIGPEWKGELKMFPNHVPQRRPSYSMGGEISTRGFR